MHPDIIVCSWTELTETELNYCFLHFQTSTIKVNLSRYVGVKSNYIKVNLSHVGECSVNTKVNYGQMWDQLLNIVKKKKKEKKAPMLVCWAKGHGFISPSKRIRKIDLASQINPA